MKTSIIKFAMVFLILALTSLPAMADAPLLTVWATPDFGEWTFSGPNSTPVAISVVANDPAGIAFNWLGDASAYGSSISGYRMGWDLNDPSNPNDTGWIQAEFGAWLETDPVVFNSGIHLFLVEVMDKAGNVTQASFLVTVADEVDVKLQSWGRLKAMYQ